MDLTRLITAATETSGVFTPAMASDVGISPPQFARLRRSGIIVRVCGHGHILATMTPTVERRAIAACLTWPDAIICYVTAALLHGLPVEDDGETHVLVPDGRRSMKGMTAHHWSVRPTEVIVRGPWVATDRLTTLADVLGRMPNQEAWGLFAWLATREIITPADLEAQLGARKHLYGVVRLRVMASALARGAVSPAEVRLQDFLELYEFTGWAGNVRIYRRGRIVAKADVLFSDARLIIEYDGRLAHPDDDDPDDLAREEMLNDLGYDVIRVRWEKLVRHPAVLAAEITEALTARAA